MRLIATGRERLDRFLAGRMPEFSRSRLAAFIEEGGVRVEGKVARPGLMLKAGMAVEVDELAEKPAHDLTPIALDLDVRFEDDALLVVNKPRGLAAHPAPTLKGPSLVNALLARGSELSAGSAPYRPGIVHRLDKDTTGLMAVAKTEAAHAALARQFATKRAQRVYVAVAAGDLEPERVTVDAPLARDRRNRFLMAVDPEGKTAITHLRRLARLDLGCLVVARLQTGRTHQIRAHLKAIGHPVLGDPLYAPPELRNHPLQLHAAVLAFDHPITGARIRIYAPPPDDFMARELVREGDLDAS